MYLDYNATTPIHKVVLESMLPVFEKQFGNPSSIHYAGHNANILVEEARNKIASAIHMQKSDVIFTSGATEANNLALCGMFHGVVNTPHFLVGATEHKSILESAKTLVDENLAKVDIIPVNNNGIIDCDVLKQMLSANKIHMISVMFANSETGVIHPIKKISDLAHQYDALIHCDATQALGKIEFNAEYLGLDLVSVSSHKIYGPKGCGSLIANRESRKLLSSQIRGGGQERDMRSGTLNVPGIVGFGTACDIAVSEGIKDMPRLKKLRDKLENLIKTNISNVSINGVNSKRLPNTSNIRFVGADADAIMVNTPSICISSGSACSSSTIEPSHVLTAMNLGYDAASESLRLSLGMATSNADIEKAVDIITDSVEFVRSMKKMEMKNNAN